MTRHVELLLAAYELSSGSTKKNTSRVCLLKSQNAYKALKGRCSECSRDWLNHRHHMIAEMPRYDMQRL